MNYKFYRIFLFSYAVLILVISSTPSSDLPKTWLLQYDKVIHFFEYFIFGILAIKSMKCTNSKFDDNPEIKAYIQVRDLTKNDNDKVYVFNGWMFSSSPSIAPFDHPVYDIWLVGCY